MAKCNSIKLANPRAILVWASLPAMYLVSTLTQAQASFGQVDDEQLLEEIIVTAQKREQTLQEVPVAVSVVSGDSLDEAGISSMEGIVDLVPSLTFTQGYDAESSSLSIRGIGTTVFASAVEPSVSIVVDDVVLARSGQAFQDLIDVERVEVLRGPQSTLFGKNATAGVVSVTTRAPSSTFTGEVDAMVTDDGEYQTRGTLSGPLGEDSGWRLSGYYKEFEGNTTNFFNGEDLNGYDAWGMRGKLVLLLSDALELTVIGDYRDSNATPQAVIRELTVPSNADLIAPVVVKEENVDVTVDGDVFADSEQSGISVKADYQFDNDFTFTSITAFRDWEQFYNQDIDITSNGPLPPNINTWNINRGLYDLTQTSQEFRITSPKYDNFDFIIGAYFFNSNLHQDFDRRWETVTVNRSNSYEGEAEVTNSALFTNTNVHVTDALTVFGGFRYLNEKLAWDVFRDSTQHLVPGDLSLPGPQGLDTDVDDSISDSAVTGTLGMRHEIGDLGNAYISYSRGYKGAGYNLVFATTNDQEPVDAEEVDAYEVGLKLRSYNGHVAANMALFYTDYRNYQAQSRGESESDPFVLRNAGDVSTKGFEADLSFLPTDLLNITAGFALIKAEIEKFPGGPCFDGQTVEQGCINGAQDLAGGDLPNSPDTRVTLAARQMFPLDNLPFDAFIQANALYQSEVQYALNQDPRAVEDGYTIINAAVGITSDNDSYTLQLIGRNLTDQFYAGQLAPSPSLGGRVIQQVARGSQRYYGLQGSISF